MQASGGGPGEEESCQLCSVLHNEDQTPIGCVWPEVASAEGSGTVGLGGQRRQSIAIPPAGPSPPALGILGTDHSLGPPSPSLGGSLRPCHPFLQAGHKYTDILYPDTCFPPHLQFPPLAPSSPLPAALSALNPFLHMFPSLWVPLMPLSTCQPLCACAPGNLSGPSRATVGRGCPCQDPAECHPCGGGPALTLSRDLHALFHRKVYITKTTLACLNGDYEVEPGH